MNLLQKIVKIISLIRPDNNEPIKKEKKEVPTNSGNEAEILAAKQRESLPVEERISMFKSMLLEKEVCL